MHFRKALSRWKNDLKHELGLGSQNSTSSSSFPSDQSSSAHPVPEPLPRTEPPPYSAPASLTLTPTSKYVSASASAIYQPGLMGSSIVLLPSEIPKLDRSSEFTSAVPHHDAKISVPSDTPEPGESSSKTAWDGLKMLLRVLESSTEVFGPLKLAIEGLNRCIDIYERAAKGHDGYGELRIKLNSLVSDLSQFIGGKMSPTMTMSMKNLSIGIDAEVEFLLQKYERGTVEQYLEALEDSEEVMECYRRIQGHLERLTLNANLSMWGIIDEQATEGRLRQLLPATSATYNSAESEDVKRRPCTTGTREQELVKLLIWARDKEAEDVYWLNGMAGTGKTTIAYSLCADLDKTAELGASFFCSRLIPECRNVKLILPSIAYQLARFSYPFRSALSRVLEADPDAHTRTLKSQFESLIAKPLLAAKHTLPADLVVVIDALDECEGEDGVGQILDVLLTHTTTSNLPIRFLMSSRPEPEIYRRMMKRVGEGFNSRLVLHDLDAATVKHDIQKYLEEELKDVPLTGSEFAALVEQSGVLFIYAATAARYIKDGLELMEHKERLDTILGLLSASPGDSGHVIDTLYSTILDEAFKSPRFNSSNRSQMKTVLHTVLCAQEPMTLDALAGLLKLKGGNQVEALLRPLCSVLNIAETSGLVTTLHASFPDFMFDKARSSTFYCDPVANHGRLAQLCFEAIKLNDPQFNICALESSYLFDDEVADLTTRVDQAVSLELFYACRYWVAHLELAEQSSELSNMLFDFLAVRLLLWMEILNVKKIIHLGARIMQRAENWSSGHNCSKEIIELAHDSWKFVTMFAGHAVSQSTPHIYVSMVPLWPEPSPIAEHYARRMRAAIEARGTAMTRPVVTPLATWPFDLPFAVACSSPDGSLIAFGTSFAVYVISGTTGRPVAGPLEHSGPVKSITFSPDNARVASGSWDKTIRVWDAYTGRAVADPLEGHTGTILSVAFSPNGTRIASGSTDATIRVWDAQTGHLIFGPFQSQVSWVRSVCFSPDGTRIASGYMDGTLKLWDIRSGQVVVGPLDKHTDEVSSVCFSPDGTRIATGSHDCTIRVWGVTGGEMIAGPLTGHTERVLSVHFSPDGKHIVSGSRDFTIRLWDVGEIQAAAGLLGGHTDSVTFAAFTSDGKRIVTCSNDRTIRVWDAQGGYFTGSASEGHTRPVRSVKFSPDGTRIASGSDDCTFKVWDASSGLLVSDPLSGCDEHAEIQSVCFSPDGDRIACGSDNITIWGVRSGQAVIGPLEEPGQSLVFSLDFSPDGTRVVSCVDSRIRVRDARSGETVVGPFEGHTQWINSVRFSPNGTLIASSSSDLTVRVWCAQSGQMVTDPFEGHTEYVRSVRFSPDSTLIASGSDDCTVRVWNIQTRDSIFTLEGHADIIQSVDFSPDGSRIVSGSADRTIRIWDVRSGRMVGDPLFGHSGGINSVAFSPDGERIVSGSDDLAIRVWDLSNLPGIQEHEGSTSDHSHHNEISPTAGLSRSWAWDEGGWVVDTHLRLLAWVPFSLHPALIFPHNTLLLSGQGDFRLDIDSAKLGESWAECYEPTG